MPYHANTAAAYSPGYSPGVTQSWWRGCWLVPLCQCQLPHLHHHNLRGGVLHSRSSCPQAGGKLVLQLAHDNQVLFSNSLLTGWYCLSHIHLAVADSSYRCHNLRSMLWQWETWGGFGKAPLLSKSTKPICPLFPPPPSPLLYSSLKAMGFVCCLLAGVIAFLALRAWKINSHTSPPITLMI